jgi:voltage-gated potassium channel
MVQWFRLFTGTVLLMVVYFAVPVRAESGLGWRLAVAGISVLLAGALIARQVRHLADAPLWALGFALVAAVLAFAMADYLIANSDPDEFAGLRTRLDALYFAVTTLGTVGFGDVHAQSQLARGVVTGQIVFNIMVIATAGSLLVSQARERRSTRK